jgi:hypothetical protein
MRGLREASWLRPAGMVETFSYPFEFFFPRKNNSTSDGPDPEPWQMTLDSLAFREGRSAQSIYDGLGR